MPKNHAKRRYRSYKTKSIATKKKMPVNTFYLLWKYWELRRGKNKMNIEINLNFLNKCRNNIWFNGIVVVSKFNNKYFEQ